MAKVEAYKAKWTTVEEYDVYPEDEQDEELEEDE